MPQPPTKWILVYFTLTAGLLAVMVPTFEAPDEPSHLEYVNYVAINLALPNQLVPEKTVVGEGVQPPLYYILTAALVRALNRDHRIDTNPIPNRQAAQFGGERPDVPLFDHSSGSFFDDIQDKISFYVLRLLSVLTALINLIFIFKIAKLYTDDPRWQLFPVVFVATLPQFGFTSAIVNNDSLANLLTTLVIYCLLRLLKDPDRRSCYLLTGLFLGIGLATKKFALIMLPELAVLMIYFATKKRVLLKGSDQEHPAHATAYPGYRKLVLLTELVDL